MVNLLGYKEVTRLNRDAQREQKNIMLLRHMLILRD